jgi:hypothetical protein
MEAKLGNTKPSKQIEKPTKRQRPSFDDEHWSHFFEEAYRFT